MTENRPPGKNPPAHSNPGARSVRRNLFGRDTERQLDDLTRDREELSQRQELQFREKWNFDLTTNMPLDGKYKWGEGIPLNQPTSLLHVPTSSGEASTASSTTTVATVVVENIPHVSVLSSTGASAGASTSTGAISSPTSSSQGSSCEVFQPPLKRQRSSSSEDISEDHTPSKSPKR